VHITVHNCSTQYGTEQFYFLLSSRQSLFRHCLLEEAAVHKRVIVIIINLWWHTHAFATAEKRVQWRPLFCSFTAADWHGLVIAEQTYKPSCLQRRLQQPSRSQRTDVRTHRTIHTVLVLFPHTHTCTEVQRHCTLQMNFARSFRAGAQPTWVSE